VFKNMSLYRFEKRFAEMEDGIEKVLWRVALRSTGETITAPTLTRLEAEVRTIQDSIAPLRSGVTFLRSDTT
jgi:hypothetical protein